MGEFETALWKALCGVGDKTVEEVMRDGFGRNVMMDTWFMEQAQEILESEDARWRGVMEMARDGDCDEAVGIDRREPVGVIIVTRFPYPHREFVPITLTNDSAAQDG